MNGVDISKHNNLKEKDFAILKSNGIDFVIIRAGFGKSKTQEDPCFKNYYKWSKNAGLKVGAYWYSYAMNVAEIKKECDEIATEEFRNVVNALRNWNYQMAGVKGILTQAECILNVADNVMEE